MNDICPVCYWENEPIEDPNDKNHLVIDEEAAEVVRLIFDLALSNIGVVKITSEFPFAKGFSVSNLKNMAKFYREYCDAEIGQTPSVQIPWSHNLEILRVKSKEQRLWYINKTIENDWSVNILAHQKVL